ncbi:Pisatin demethylase [Cytospora mali]|uniref:Pisatin demethylase n=1 Tax=Cytospora mali TaxID=578113 RepID=A0A194V312_CYTMA|nr:Pisatin demethylase [Valsa mali var. pyri (nom. inval.)]
MMGLEVNLSAVTLGVSLAFFLVALRTWLAWRYLRHIPGPPLASITDLQRMSWVKTKKAHLILQDVHEKYGEVVRIGPKTISFSNPEAITTSKFYVTLQPYTPKGGSLHAIFNTPDENIHKQLKSPIANFFTPNNVLLYESHVDDVLTVLQEKLDSKYIGHDQIFELSSWMQFFAFDVMGTLTFSKRYGFLDTGKDVGNMLKNIKDFMRTAAPWTQIPQLDAILRKNRIGDWVQRHFFTAASMGILGFVGKAIEEKREVLGTKRQSRDGTAQLDNKTTTGNEKDFLTRYLEILEASPKTVPAWAPTAWTFSNVIAGSDSVGSLMCTTMFNLLVYPHTLQKLLAELQGSNASRPFPRYGELRNLPYLNACVLEGIRMHPPFCLPLERVVPKGGIRVLDHIIPEGTVIGGSPYVVNRHKGTFGDDAEFWRPERWLERGEEHKKKLEASMLTFGSGRRICLGKYLGTLEITKLIAFLVLNYDIRIVDPERFTVENSWFFFQEGLYATIRHRAEKVVKDEKESELPV